MRKAFPFELQQGNNDCGPTALKMVAQYYEKPMDLHDLCDICLVSEEGVSLKNLKDGAEKIGLRTMAVRCSFDELSKFVPLPAIALWGNRHFVVVYEITIYRVYIADPINGDISLSIEDFCYRWYQGNEKKGILLAMELMRDKGELL